MDISELNNNEDIAKSKAPDCVLDITREVCPMTFVRTRLALDRMATGKRLLVLLRGEEPARNVPRTARDQGHVVLEQSTDSDGLTRVLIRKAGH